MLTCTVLTELSVISDASFSTILWLSDQHKSNLKILPTSARSLFENNFTNASTMQQISFSCLRVNCARLLSYTIYHFHPHLHCQTCEEHLFLLSRQKRMSIPLKCFTHPWIHSSHIFHFSSRVRSHFCISSNSIGKIISKRIERTAIKSTRCLCILYICADCYWLNWFNAIHSDSYERRISKCFVFWSARRRDTDSPNLCGTSQR